MSDGSSNPSWFPTPPPKPLTAPSAAKLFFGTIVPAVAVVVTIAWMSSGHSGQTAKVEATPAIVAVTAQAQDRRHAFRECLRSMGAGTSFRLRGRFGDGAPSKRVRSAFDVCRSLLQAAPAAPVAPTQTGTTAAPVA